MHRTTLEQSYRCSFAVEADDKGRPIIVLRQVPYHLKPAIEYALKLWDGTTQEEAEAVAAVLNEKVEALNTSEKG